MDNSISIHDGRQQINPAATQAIQNNIFMPPATPEDKTGSRTVVILGAGADSAMGLPASDSLIPRIVDYLETDEGREVDASLRKLLKRLTFRFDKFVDNTIDSLAKDLDNERDAICANIRRELETNGDLDGTQRDMGNLIVRILSKITDIKNGASIDPETERLIHEVLGTDITDDTIIDFSRISYTGTFKTVIVEILHKSMRDAGNPVLRHVYKNLLDIEQLLAQYFYGFFTGRQGHIKNYLYISWVLWAFLVHEEQAAATRQTDVKDGMLQAPLPSVYSRLRDRNVQVITFNYTSFAARSTPDALYFNGSLTEYVDIENKNDLSFGAVADIDVWDFFRNSLPAALSLDGERTAIPIPSFMPPLKLKPVISQRYITTWYRAGEAVARARRILILGHSLHSNGTFFNDMLRGNRRAGITVIDRDMSAVCHNLCAILQLSPNRYTTLTVQGYPARKYDNRITVVQADLKDIDLSEWLEE